VGLGAAGKALWRRLLKVYELEEHEAALLTHACRQADDVAALEEVVGRDGYVVEGSQGQSRLNMAVTELRQSRLALGRLLAQVGFPDEADRPMTEKSRRAQRVANSRWDRIRQWEAG
jgi:hypothetical protein